MAIIIDNYNNYEFNVFLSQEEPYNGQSFRTTSVNSMLHSYAVWLYRAGLPVGTLHVEIHAHEGTYGVNSKPTGPPLATSNSMAVSSVSTAEASRYEFIFSGASRIQLAANTAYVAVLVITDGPSLDDPFYVAHQVDTTSPTHPGNKSYYDAEMGAWYAQPSWDTRFELSADLPPILLPSSITTQEAFGTPTLQPGAIALSPPSIASAEAFGLPLLALFLSQSSSIASAESVGTPEVAQSDPPPPPATDWSALGKEDEKVYVYHVSSPAGTFIGTWPDVTDKPQFTQGLNTPFAPMTVQIGRSPNNKREDRGYLLSQAGDRIVSEAGDPIVTVTETPNNVGPGTDIDLNYNVDVYVVYGQFDRLIAQNGDYITSENGDYILVSTGAPMGRRIFSGFILDYQTEYGDKNGVTVTLASHGYELSHQLVRSGSNTTVTYTTTELGAIAKALLDTNPGKITYDSGSIAGTATSRTMKFVVNSKREAIESVYEQTPDGWYWFVDPADNLLYLRPISSTADHTFVAGRDIKSLKVKQTIEALVNEVYFVGGEVTPGTPSSTLFKRYEESTSLSAYPRRGLKRITDRRYTVATNAQARAGKDFSRFKNPIFTSPLVISATRYDIETIRLGQTVQFRGFGNFLDDLAPLQIVRRGYTPTEVILELGDVQERQVETVAGLQQGLANEQYIDLPNAPS